MARRPIKRWNKLTHSNAKRARTSKYLQNAMKAVKSIQDTTEFSAIIGPLTPNRQVVTLSSENSQCWRIALFVFSYVVFFPTHYTLAHPTVLTVPLEFYSMSHTSTHSPFSEFSWRKFELLTKQQQEAFW